MRWQRAAYALLLVAICLPAGGCSPEWKRKFIRKKKEKPVQAVLVLQSGANALHPPRARYREHFAFWKSWHIALQAELGENGKRDRRNLKGVVDELRAMYALLAGSPEKERLKGFIAELAELEGDWQAAGGPWRVTASTRSRLERIYRRVNAEFHYARVEEVLARDPEGKSADGEAAAEPAQSEETVPPS